MAMQAQLYSDNIGFPLGCSPDLVMDNGCGFNDLSSCFNLQQKQNQRQNFQHLQYQQQQMVNQNMCFGNTVVVPTSRNSIAYNNRHPSVPNNQSILAAQMELQRQELDQYMRLQNEKLIMVLQEQRKQQLGLMLKKLESKASTLLRQKDAEIAQAGKRTMELEEFLRKLEMERQQWQSVTQENEAMVVSLNNTLEELREKACCSSNNGAEDAESCCDVNMTDNRETEEATGESRGLLVDGVEQRTRKIVMTTCKGCHSRGACMLFLPCRHLCSCKNCETFLDHCPVCTTAKKASIEALIF